MLGKAIVRTPCSAATLDAADEKNRQGNDVPLRDDLAADLREWLQRKLDQLQQEALRTDAPVPAPLPRRSSTCRTSRSWHEKRTADNTCQRLCRSGRYRT
jgi:hypothetical protein